MIATIRSEWIKIRTTAVPWVLGGIAIVINGLLILVYFVTHDSTGGGGQQRRRRAGNGTFGFPNYPHTTHQLRNLMGSGFTGLSARPSSRRPHRHYRVPAQDGDHVLPGHSAPSRSSSGRN